MVSLSVLLGQETSQAQYGQRTVPELDRLPNWYFIQVPDSEWQTDNPTQSTNYSSIRDLVQKASAGRKVEALTIDGDRLKPDDLALLRQLKQVRVLYLNGLTAQKVDSLIKAIDGWPLLERLSLNGRGDLPGPNNRTDKIRLPASLQHCPKLAEIWLTDSQIDWVGSLPVLANVKTLRHLELRHGQSSNRSLPDLSQLPQIKALKN